MYERLEKCPVCGKSSFRNKLIVEDKSVSGESFAIVQCEACTFQFTNPRPDAAAIGRYYESAAYVSHNSAAAGVINQVYRLARKFTMRRKVALLNRLAPRRGKLLDYGCGTGHFLAAAKRNGWQVAGFEPNERARQEATQRVGQSIEHVSLTNLEAGSFEVITLWHVLEHVHTLNQTLDQLISLLKPDGVLLIAVPNVESFDAHHYRENWAAYDVPRHLYHFSPKTMALLLKKHKLKLLQTLPMTLDAYYVSMLSEQHKHMGQERNMLRVLRTGYASNRYAADNGNQYSSLIYVATRK